MNGKKPLLLQGGGARERCLRLVTISLSKLRDSPISRRMAYLSSPESSGQRPTARELVHGRALLIGESFAAVKNREGRR